MNNSPAGSAPDSADVLTAADLRQFDVVIAELERLGTELEQILERHDGDDKLIAPDSADAALFKANLAATKKLCDEVVATFGRRDHAEIKNVVQMVRAMAAQYP